MWLLLPPQLVGFHLVKMRQIYGFWLFDLKSMSRLIDRDQLMHILNEENPNPKEQQQVMFFLAQDIYSKVK